MKTLIIKSHLTSLWQREDHTPLRQRGVGGGFCDYDVLLMHSLVKEHLVRNFWHYLSLL